MYYGYCFVPSLRLWMPARTLQTAEDVMAYCRLQHQLFPAIRITDADDCCVLHVVRHVMYCPLSDGTFSALNLSTGAQTILARGEVDAAVEDFA